MDASGAAAQSSGTESCSAQKAPNSETPNKAADGEGEGSEDEAESLSNTVTDEVKVLLQSKRSNLTAAKEKKESLEENLANIGESVSGC